MAECEDDVENTHTHIATRYTLSWSQDWEPWVEGKKSEWEEKNQRVFFLLGAVNIFFGKIAAWYGA